MLGGFWSRGNDSRLLDVGFAVYGLCGGLAALLIFGTGSLTFVDLIVAGTAVFIAHFASFVADLRRLKRLRALRRPDAAHGGTLQRQSGK